MKKRIAHFIETDVPGGAETMLLTLCERTRSDSVEPVVIHFNHPFFLEECSKRGLEQIVISNNKLFKKTALLPFFAIQFASILVKNRIDVVHSHLFGPIVGASLGAFIARKKHLGTLHDTYMIEEKPKRIKLLELASRLGTKLICVSQTMERFYRSEGSFQVNAITTIYNSVPKPTLSQNAQHVDPNQKDAPFIFFTSGRLVKLKRIQDLISAGAELKKQSTNFKILIAGSGPEENYLNQLVEDGHLEDVITFLGYRTDINELLSCSDVYVQCSETEGLSMSILEAMSLGLPCIVSDVGANHEMVVPSENGYLYPTGDVTGLAKHMLNIMKDQKLKHQLGKGSLSKFNETFAYEKMCHNYLLEYGDLPET